MPEEQQLPPIIPPVVDTPVNTETITKSVTTNQPPDKDSTIFGVSVRAWIVLMVIGTLCLTVIMAPVLGYLISGDIVIEIKEPFYSVVGLVVGFYFGQSVKKT